MSLWALCHSSGKSKMMNNVLWCQLKIIWVNIDAINGFILTWHQAIITRSNAECNYWTAGNKLWWNSIQNTKIFCEGRKFLKYAVEYVVCKMTAILFRPQCVRTSTREIKHQNNTQVNVQTDLDSTYITLFLTCYVYILMMMSQLIA